MIGTMPMKVDQTYHQNFLMKTDELILKRPFTFGIKGNDTCCS